MYMYIDLGFLFRIFLFFFGFFGWFCCGFIFVGIFGFGRDILVLGGFIFAGRKFMGLLGLWKGGYFSYG